MRKPHRFVAVAISVILGVGCLIAQQDSFTKSFQKLAGVASGIDFYARNRGEISPFEKPVQEAQRRLADYLGSQLAKGAIVICSSLEQRDSVSEARVIKMGYGWVLIQLTPEASEQQMLAQMKAQLGDQMPPGLAERMRTRSPEARSGSEARLVSATVLRMVYAILSMTLAPDLVFRSSRLDDLGRSPLADWLDVGLASYAAGNLRGNLRFLQDRLEEAFPIEDVLSMSRPFVAPSSGGSPGGSMFVFRTGGGPGEGSGRSEPGERTAGSGSGEGPGRSGQGEGSSRGGSGGGTGGGGQASSGGSAAEGGRSRSASLMPKDVQDRMMFDAQAALFFAFLIEKLGPDKTKEVVQWSRTGKDATEILTREGFLGPDFAKVENDWQAWVKEQKPDAPGGMRVITDPGRPPSTFD